MPNPYSQRAIERRIRAAIKAGLVVTGVAPDGTVITDQRGQAPSTQLLSPVVAPPSLTHQPKLRDAREKLG